MSSTPRLSIVIPVFNAEATIKRCLDSIWAARLDVPYEVICVDDCSRDGSTALIEEISREHEELRLLRNPKNLHAGGARNHGAREARGEYMLFIDSDDYFDSEALAEAVKKAVDEKLDILMCNSCREIEGGKGSPAVHNISDDETRSGKDFLHRNGIPLAPWKYIFRRNLMTDKNIWFVEGVSAEDGDWVLRLTLEAQRMAFLDRVLVHYILTPQSQTGVTTFKACREVLMEARRVLDIYEEHKGKEEYADSILAIARGLANDGLRRMLLCYAPLKDKAEVIKLAQSPDLDDIRRVKHSVLYASISNLLFPFASVAQKIKRSIAGRV